MPRAAPSGSSSSLTWTASSRVGTRIRARGRRGSAALTRSSTGRPKARVLPEPVLALPQTSRPARASGMVSAWTGKGDVRPMASSAATKSGETPRSEKDGMRASEGSGVVRRPTVGVPTPLSRRTSAPQGGRLATTDRGNPTGGQPICRAPRPSDPSPPAPPNPFWWRFSTPMRYETSTRTGGGWSGQAGRLASMAWTSSSASGSTPGRKRPTT